MRFVLHVMSLIALAIAVIMAVVDATRSIATAEWTFTPLMQSWQANFPKMLSGIESYFTQNGPAVIWDPGMMLLLSLPGWLVFGVLAGLLHLASRPPRRMRGMAAEQF